METHGVRAHTHSHSLFVLINDNNMARPTFFTRGESLAGTMHTSLRRSPSSQSDYLNQAEAFLRPKNLSKRCGDLQRFGFAAD